jgi:formamidopyrimidine-DNA glycosylase
MTQLDYDLDEYYNEKDYECTECGTPIESKGVCSRDCFKSSML